MMGSIARRRLATIALGTCIALAGGAMVRAGQIPVLIASLGVVTATPADSQSVQDFLKSYESTLASGRVESIAKLYAGSDARQQAVLDDYFKNVISDLVVRLDDVSIDVQGDRAMVAFDRTDSFIDRKSGNKVEKKVEVERTLQRQGGSWRIELAS